MIRRSFAFAVLLLTAAAAGGSCIPSFSSAPTFFPAGSASSARVLNLDGDEWVDVLTFSEGGLWTLRGQAHRAFAAPVPVSTGARVFDVDAADFDGDGDNDLVACDSSRAAVLYLRNDDGALHEVSSHPYAGDIIAGDFNGDARPDFVVAGYGSTQLVLMLGAGDGTFTPHTVSTSGHRNRGVGNAVADLDRDGRDDLVVLYDDLAFALAFGNGSGFTFVNGEMLARPRVSAIGDLDGNGELDVLISAGLDTRAAVVFNAGRRSNASSPKFVPHYFGLNAPVIMNIDAQRGDEVIGNNAIYRWTDAGFVSEPYFDLEQVLPADVDRDGLVDLIALSNEGVSVVRNLGEGRLDAPQPTAHGNAIVDMNDDGRDDIFAGGEVYFAGPGGSFPVTTAGSQQLSPAFGDVDGDGDLDSVYVYSLSFGGWRIVAGLNDGTGKFTPIATPLGHDDHVFDPRLLSDVDGDGRLDVVTASDSYGTLAVWISRGNGDGTFGVAEKQVMGTGSGRSQFLAGDYDGDGRVDLLRFLNDFTIIRNLGNGVFGDLRSPSFPASVVMTSRAADVDGDGRDDLVIAGPNKLTVVINGSDAWTKRAEVATFTSEPATPIVRDFNRDGIRDIFVPLKTKSANSGSATLFLGSGGGDFTAGHAIWTQAGSTLAGDFDGNGLPDLLDGGRIRMNHCPPPRRRSVR